MGRTRRRHTQNTKNESARNEQKTQKTPTPEIYHGEEVTPNHLMHGKRLITRKLNSKIHILQKWIRRKKCTPYPKPGRKAETHTDTRRKKQKKQT